MSWHFIGKVLSNDISLFVSPNPNPEPLFKPTFYSDIASNIGSEIISICNNNIECIYDSILTNNTNIGKASSNVDQKNKVDQDQLCKWHNLQKLYNCIIIVNFPPNITGNDTILVKPNVLIEYTFTVTDDNDNEPHVETFGSLPDEAILINTGNKQSYYFTWDISKSTNITILVVATDKYNASSALRPQVCSNCYITCYIK